MGERQLTRVQHLSWRRVTSQFGQPLVLTVPVSVIPHQREAEELEMDANLVRPASVQESFGEGRTAQPLQKAIAGARLPPGVFIDGHSFAMGGVTPDGGPDFAALALHLAANNRMINFFHFAAGKLGRERKVRVVILGYDQTSAGFFVEAMDDARAELVFGVRSATRKRLTAAEQRIDQSAAGVPGAGMDAHACWLVDDKEVVVFVENIERDCFRFSPQRRAWRRFYGDSFASAQFLRSLCGRAVYQDEAGIEEFLHPGPREFRKMGYDPAIETETTIIMRDDELVRNRRGRHLSGNRWRLLMLIADTRIAPQCVSTVWFDIAFSGTRIVAMLEALD